MDEKRPQKWAQPVDDRDRRRDHHRPSTSSDAYEELDECTPKPIDVEKITPAMAWEHADRVNKRSVDMLTHIAHSSGVGMDVADRVRDIETLAHRHDKKLKWWQALIIAAMTASGAAVVAAAKGLYASGEKDGVSEMRLRSLELQMERQYHQIQKLSDEIRDMLRSRGRRESTPVRTQ